jgi:hypothetical protein
VRFFGCREIDRNALLINHLHHYRAKNVRETQAAISRQLGGAGGGDDDDEEEEGGDGTDGGGLEEGQALLPDTYLAVCVIVRVVPPHMFWW